MLISIDQVSDLGNIRALYTSLVNHLSLKKKHKNVEKRCQRGFIFLNYVSSKGSMLNVCFDLLPRLECNLHLIFLFIIVHDVS